MSASSFTSSFLFGVSSSVAELGGDIFDSNLCGTNINYTGFGIGFSLSLISLGTPAPIDKAIGIVNIGVGTGFMPFNYEIQKWNSIRTIQF